jgi:hypothetical protein
LPDAGFADREGGGVEVVEGGGCRAVARLGGGG